MATKKKWSAGDIIVLILQVLAPLSAILFTCFLPKGQALSSDIKLAIVGAGIVVPIILLQFSVIIGQNKSERDVQELNDEVQDISDRINHISPVLEQVFIFGNDRAKRFVYRRMEEVTKILQTALNTNNSGDLRPSEYYEELLHLAKLIISDHAESKDNFKGEIWAMTSFADEEWIEDEGYEKLWIEKLSYMVDKGIKTRRLCVVPDKIVELISGTSFVEKEANNIKSFQGFINYLETYYGAQSKNTIAEHYFIRTNDNNDLTQIKGFFAIKLSSGELHILHGETVDKDGALTARVLFDPNEIRRVHELFELHARPTQELSRAIINLSKQNNGFLDYLKKRGIEFTAN